MFSQFDQLATAERCFAVAVCPSARTGPPLLRWQAAAALWQWASSLLFLLPAGLIQMMLWLLHLVLLVDLSYSLYFMEARKSYGFRRRRWDRPMLTWRLDTRNINTADEYIMRNTLHRAFDEWQAVSAIHFTEKEDDGSPTDLVVAFERGRHDDQFPFDGKDGIVAHAFFPRDGRLHFDADEDWTLNSAAGVNLFQTAVHEVGHLLGLPHSKDPGAVMNIAKKPYDPEFRLAADDIRAIQRLYPLIKPHPSGGQGQDPMMNTFPFALPPQVRHLHRRFNFLRI